MSIGPGRPRTRPSNNTLPPDNRADEGLTASGGSNDVVGISRWRACGTYHIQLPGSQTPTAAVPPPATSRPTPAMGFSRRRRADSAAWRRHRRNGTRRDYLGGDISLRWSRSGRRRVNGPEHAPETGHATAATAAATIRLRSSIGASFQTSIARKPILGLRWMLAVGFSTPTGGLRAPAANYGLLTLALWLLSPYRCGRSTSSARSARRGPPSCGHPVHLGGVGMHRAREPRRGLLGNLGSRRRGKVSRLQTGQLCLIQFVRGVIALHVRKTAGVMRRLAVRHLARMAVARWRRRGTFRHRRGGRCRGDRCRGGRCRGGHCCGRRGGRDVVISRGLWTRAVRRQRGSAWVRTRHAHRISARRVS